MKKKSNWKKLLSKAGNPSTGIGTLIRRPTCKNCNTYSWTITIMLVGILFMVWAYKHDIGYERLMECNDRYEELASHMNLVNPPYQLLEDQIEDGFPGFMPDANESAYTFK